MLSLFSKPLMLSHFSSSCNIWCTECQSRPFRTSFLSSLINYSFNSRKRFSVLCHTKSVLENFQTLFGSCHHFFWIIIIDKGINQMVQAKKNLFRDFCKSFVIDNLTNHRCQLNRTNLCSFIMVFGILSHDGAHAINYKISGLIEFVASTDFGANVTISFKVIVFYLFCIILFVIERRLFRFPFLYDSDQILNNLGSKCFRNNWSTKLP
ncbi:hypothetical protein CLUG_04236 [Clavispora lusitaniae ATCC 42720]|uniref:Uncharacterized protein n=1 Tax=Clavispora lusitaniae (strain ATCC 42720) TaxID=306902 RepID=C4Y7Q8_CLAL4|nr:uncharacterized protein CLUG_04236 [Clavispora lusitaniae ATCC 42720]EEQ40108.1 hypothetical protein CLUG_04236 [Clavispora lusitaniae ATCC 42720]